MFPTFGENVSSASSITLNLSALVETIDGKDFSERHKGVK